MAEIYAKLLMRSTFNHYAAKDGVRETLSKGELAEMLRKEIPGAANLTDVKVNEFFRTLDANHDGCVDFDEYRKIVNILFELIG
ncbi:ictacalcin-like [Plectropomus leopardus]|uniref:ictacalcin-like n=1 Tax=Plectropomus leopardus TaxID=160734 RepID=UPI001C4DCEEE|nr:ictacalcin-like [Plectropomus leopardus]